MPDLQDQIRAYYEATTQPVDVDALTVELGAVLVRLSPDTAKRSSTKRPEGSPVKRRWRGAGIAAATALVVIIAGVALSFDTGGGVEPALPSPTSQPGPIEDTTLAPGYTVDEALQVVDQYWAAYDEGDFATVESLFTPDATTERFSRPHFFAWIEQYRAWRFAQGGTQTERDCQASERADGLVDVACGYEDMPVLREAIGAPPVLILIEMEVGPDGIGAFWFTPYPHYITNPFLDWMEEHHPGVAPAPNLAMPITLSNSVEEAELFGRIRAEYADEWAAYLEANGCAYPNLKC